MSSKEEKRLVYVSKSLVDELVKLARKHSTSISKLVEDSVRYLVQVDQLELNLEEAVEILRAFKLLRVLGGIFIPQYLLERTGQQLAKPAEDKPKKWYEVGRAYGVYLKEMSPNPVRSLKAFLAVMRWDLSEVSISGNENTYKLCCTSLTMNEEDTAHFVEFIKGVLDGLNAEISKVECARGLIIVEFKIPG